MWQPVNYIGYNLYYKCNHLMMGLSLKICRISLETHVKVMVALLCNGIKKLLAQRGSVLHVGPCCISITLGYILSLYCKLMKTNDLYQLPRGIVQQMGR